MQLVISETELIDLLVIDLPEEVQREILKVQDERNLGRINSKQFRLKILSTILRSEAG